MSIFFLLEIVSEIVQVQPCSLMHCWLKSELNIFVSYTRGRQPLARVPQVAREGIFYGTPSDLTRMRNLLYKRARRTPKLKLSTLHEINSPKICQACNSLDNFYVGDVCCGSANDTRNWFAVKAKKLAQDNPVYAISH